MQLRRISFSVIIQQQLSSGFTLFFDNNKRIDIVLTFSGGVNDACVPKMSGLFLQKGPAKVGLFFERDLAIWRVCYSL